MDFNTETQGAINKIVAEKLPEMIEKQAEIMINDIVKDLFGYSSGIRKEIKAKIEQGLNVNLQQFDLIDYNSLIANTINMNLISQVNLEPILKMTQEIVGFVDRKTIRLQEIANFFEDASRSENDQEGEGEFTFIVKENENKNWIEVFADVDPDKDENECQCKFIFSTKEDGDRNGLIFSFRVREEYYDKSHHNITPARLVNFRSIEAKIFRLYSAQVQITNYNDEISNYWDRY